MQRTIRKAQWKPATSPQFRDAPHSYIVRMKEHGVSVQEWERFAKLIGKSGVYREWRGRHFKYLVIRRDAFWCVWPCLNRADVRSLK